MIGTKKVTIIVPVFKAEKYLKCCIDSILSQTYKNIEVLLVDDGSNDACPQICDDYAKEHECVCVIHKKNEGAAIAREVGLARSTGHYIAFVDSDDWIEPEYIETMVALAEKHKADAVIGNFKRFCDEKIYSKKQYFEEGYYNKTRLIEEIYSQMLSANNFYTFGIAPAMWGKLFLGDMARKPRTQQFLGKITQGEDSCFTYSYLLDCNSIYIADNDMYIYRDNPVSVSHGFNFKLFEETKLLREYLESVSKTKNWNTGTQLEEYIAFMCYNITTRALINYNGKFKELRKHLKKYKKTNLPLNILTNINFRKTATFKMKIMFFLLTINLFMPMQIFLRRWIKK